LEVVYDVFLVCYIGLEQVPQTGVNPCPKMILLRLRYLKEIESQKDELISSIGHQNIAEHVGLDKNRINIQLGSDDVLYIVISTLDENNETHYTYKKLIII
jgi:hypothetical protein